MAQIVIVTTCLILQLGRLPLLYHNVISKLPLRYLYVTFTFTHEVHCNTLHDVLPYKVIASNNKQIPGSLSLPGLAECTSSSSGKLILC